MARIGSNTAKVNEYIKAERKNFLSTPAFQGVTCWWLQWTGARLETVLIKIFSQAPKSSVLKLPTFMDSKNCDHKFQSCMIL